MSEKVTNQAIIEAAKRLKGKIVRTPLLKSDHVNKELKSNIYIKAENLQTIGAFKFRGAMNTILQLPPDENISLPMNCQTRTIRDSI